MSLSRAALTAAVVTVVLWTAKAVAIGVAGGLGRSPLEGPLFLLGLVACVVAAVLTGVALTDRRVVGGLLGFVGFSVFGALEGAAVAAATPAHPGWVWGEVNLWILALAVLAASAALVVRRERVAAVG